MAFMSATSWGPAGHLALGVRPTSGGSEVRQGKGSLRRAQEDTVSGNRGEATVTALCLYFWKRLGASSNTGQLVTDQQSTRVSPCKTDRQNQALVVTS